LGAANMFTFGIGSSVNRYLIEGMAYVGKGEPLVITDIEDSKEKAEQFRKYINSPVLTDVKVKYNGFDVYDVQPISVPDVLAERPVVVYGKYKGEPSGSITVKGNAGSKNFRKTFNIADEAASEENAALKYLWARERIKELDYYNNAGYMNDDGIGNEIKDLGLKYSLLTQYTSFIAVDKDIANPDKKLTTSKQPLPMPEGVDNSAVGFELKVAGMSMNKESLKGRKSKAGESAKAPFTVVEKALIVSYGTALEAKIKANATAKTKTGDLKVQLSLDRNGNVTGIKLLRNGVDKSLAALIEAEMMKWIFDPANDKRTLALTFTVEL